MPRQGLCAEINISATRAFFSAGEVVTLISTGFALLWSRRAADPPARGLRQPASGSATCVARCG